MDVRVADDEVIARFCDPRYAKASGFVKYQAFVATRWPLQISVSRAKLCSVEARAAAEKKSFAGVLTGRVHREVAEATVFERELPGQPEHAEIHVRVDAEESTDVASKDKLEAERWTVHVAHCAALAAISRANTLDAAALAA